MKLDDNRECPYDFGHVQMGGPSIAGGDPILGQNPKLRKVYASELSQRVKKRSFTKETTSPGGLPPRVRVKTVFRCCIETCSVFMMNAEPPTKNTMV